MAEPYPIRGVTEWEIRRIFNEGRRWERALAGEFVIVVTDERPAPPDPGEPPGTMSQEVEYRRDDEMIVRLHQCLRPDGTLGAGGRPDPKRILHDGVRHRIIKRKHRQQPGETGGRR